MTRASEADTATGREPLRHAERARAARVHEERRRAAGREAL